MIDKKDIINVKSWMDLGDCNYEHDHKDDSIPESGVVYCNIEHITEFFEKCKKTDNRYVVISGFSDYGVAYQEEHSVANDMLKFLPFVHHMIPNIQYNPLVIPPRCEVEECNIEHKYSVKCYSHTRATFNEIPPNVVKWFLVNPMMQEDVVQGIPLGIGKDATDTVFDTKRYELEDKSNLLYVNWQNYTLDRKYLKEYFMINNFPWCTIIVEPKEFSEYLDELSRHTFALCPDGNGVDSYRILECIYAGTIPVVLDGPTFGYLQDLPILRVESLSEVTSEFLQESLKKLSEKMDNLDMAKLSYWKNEIDKAKSLI